MPLSGHNPDWQVKVQEVPPLEMLADITLADITFFFSVLQSYTQW